MERHPAGNTAAVWTFCKLKQLGPEAMTVQNPKVDPPSLSNTEKNPDDWVSGDEPMTGAQASYLKTLSEQLGEPDAFSQSLTKAEASKRIDALKSRLEQKRHKA